MAATASSRIDKQHEELLARHRLELRQGEPLLLLFYEADAAHGLDASLVDAVARKSHVNEGAHGCFLQSAHLNA